jgi:hypothetical protein
LRRREDLDQKLISVDAHRALGMSKFPTSRENIALDIAFDLMGESRINRTPEEYAEIAARLPPIKRLHGMINDRLEVRSQRLIIALRKQSSGQPDDGNSKRPNQLEVTWIKPPSKKRREILLPTAPLTERYRPIRADARARLVAAIARGRRWLGELTTTADLNVEKIARREGCSIRKVNMTVSLAFLAPDLVKAAIEGRLPRGIGMTRLSDLPEEWALQHEVLGLAAP